MTTTSKRSIKLEKRVLEKNETLANELRRKLKRKGVVALNFISSPGSGKTLLLERTLEMLDGSIGCAVLVGDQQTDNDARRLSGKGAEVRQIETGNACHLDAERIAPLVDEVLSKNTKLLFIENVGNLVCPAAFDLGESAKAGLLSVTEGEDKPLKYPTLFSRASLVLVTKTDLAPHVDWNRNECLRNIGVAAPSARVFELSAKSGAGMKEWISYLKRLVKEPK